MTMYSCLGITGQSFLLLFFKIEQMQKKFATFLNNFEIALKM